MGGVAFQWVDFIGSGANVTWRGQKLGDLVRFRRGQYLFMGATFHRFDRFDELEQYVNGVMEKVDR